MKLTKRQREVVRKVAANLGMSDITVETVVTEYLSNQSGPSERKSKKSPAKSFEKVEVKSLDKGGKGGGKT